jgi:peptidoglycan/LPS O-acetylase OafA/YrhL
MRIEQLTFTRFIAALLIVIFHYGLDILPFNLNRQMFSGANVGVSYFFVLSGFVMIIAYHKKQRISAFEYLRNRFARIYPLYMLALLLFLAYRMVGTNVPIRIDEVVLSSFMIQSWIPGKALLLNFPGWTLSVELFFYVSVPLLFSRI